MQIHKGNQAKITGCLENRTNHSRENAATELKHCDDEEGSRDHGTVCL